MFSSTVVVTPQTHMSCFALRGAAVRSAVTLTHHGGTTGEGCSTLRAEVWWSGPAATFTESSKLEGCLSKRAKLLIAIV